MLNDRIEPLRLRGIALVRPAAVAEPQIAAAGVEQAVIRIAGLRGRIEFHRAHGVGQVQDDVRDAQELAPRALERVGSRVRRAPLRDDVVIGHILQPVPGWDEIRRFCIPRPELGVHRVQQAIRREFRVKGEADESGCEAFDEERRNDCAGDQILPVDWPAVTQRGDITTNYQ